MYDEQYDETNQALESAIRAGDFQAVRELSHSLKGSSANLSLRPLQDAAFDMEKAGREKDRSGALKALDRLEREYRRLKKYAGAALTRSDKG